MISHDTASRRLAIGLAALAGFIDALGFLSLGGVFVSFMSGNSTRFAVGLSDGASLKVALIPLGIIVLFVIGVMIGRAIRHFSRRKPSATILLFMSLTLTCAGMLHGLSATVFAVPLLAIAMGAANNIFFREGEVSVGVTYMTGTLVKFGQRLAGKLLGEPDHHWMPYLLLWAGLVGGAILGAFGYTIYGLHILWCAVVACFALTAVCSRIESKQGAK
jgi:uncharacterized membrane protein YoaK (UPF0700 family)